MDSFFPTVVRREVQQTIWMFSPPVNHDMSSDALSNQWIFEVDMQKLYKLN